MRRALQTVLILALLITPAAAAVETTTVQGKVLTPDAQAVTKGSFTAVLSSPGSAEDPNSGLFTFVDPRYGPCCRVEKGHMTNPVRMRLTPGTMLIFPGSMVHCVNPYGGTAPRITLAWNINR